MLRTPCELLADHDTLSHFCIFFLIAYEICAKSPLTDTLINYPIRQAIIPEKGGQVVSVMMYSDFSCFLLDPYL